MAQVLLASGVARAATCTAPPVVQGAPGYAMSMPISSCAAAPSHVRASTGGSSVAGSFTHVPAPNSGNDLPAGNGPVMTSMTIYYDFWLPTGQHYESNTAGDANYENLLIRFAQDLGGSQYHNLATQYSGTNGTITNNVTFGGSWVDTSTAYPHAGTTGDPLQDSDIQAEVHNAVVTNGWTEDTNHIVAVFTANGIQECNGSTCTYTGGGNGFCAYHNDWTDGSNDSLYAFMAFDNFTHVSGYTCVAGQTSNDTDPNRGAYPNGDVSADAEVNTLSHELIEANTDPHPNATWTGPNGEIGDACNFNFAPRSDIGADVYLNGDPYIVQQEWSNATHTCGIDLPTNGFCAGSVSNACAPTTTYTKTVDNPSPRVGSSVNYTLTLDNTSDTGAETNLTATDSLPAGYTVTGISAPGSTSSSSTAGSVTVGYDTLAVHQSRTVTITATVPAQSGTTATNCANLDGADLLGTSLPTLGSTCASTTPVKIPTALTYNGATTSDYNDAATVSATLTDDSSNPIGGKAIGFTLNGAEVCSAVTDSTGVASCSITPGEAAGPYVVVASFSDATDPVYATTSVSTGFTVTLEQTTTAYTGPTVILQGASGVTLSGRLLEDGATPIAGRVLTLGIGTQTCTTSPTDVSGDASCVLTVTGALGPEALSASFAGDGYYLASTDTSQSAVVFAFPKHGAFTIGSVTAATATPTTTVTWWSSRWDDRNQLSSGHVPESFKGFAEHVTLPTSTPPGVCTSTWTTFPGEHAEPPDTVPAYMGVIVTGTVTKSKWLISGDTEHIVVVKTNPGYGNDHHWQVVAGRTVRGSASHRFGGDGRGHDGTGQIVATYC